jgi:8-oxo-dGTP pyrophosphatase MutT (NUDIX family)
MPEPHDRVTSAFRVLADAVGDSRPRRPEDASDPGIPVAATVVIIRDGAAGPEVLLLERPDRGSFAGAWVFPGGKLDDADRADAREPEADSARRAGVRETHEETGLVVNADDLVTISCWDPPPGLPLRIRTWFFAVHAPASPEVEDLALSPDEAIRAEWIRPADALVRHGRGELTLYPPTWVTLDGLRDQPDAQALLATLRLGGVQQFETVARRGPGGPELLWQEDAEYDTQADAEASASGSRHRLEVGALPWIYTRTG